MIWGYAGVYPGAFGVWQGDVQMNMLRFVAEHGFKCTGVSLNELKDPARREQIARFVNDHDMHLSVRPHLNYFGDDPARLRREIDEALKLIETASRSIRIPIVTTGGSPLHRFTARPTLAEQMDRLAEGLTPLAAGCRQLGKPLGIENHGDYYISDLVGLCQRVPHLGIFLDTGNTFLVGEQSVPACRLAAPYTVGTHFKDHIVYPDPRTLTFHVTGAVLGEGHVGLREVYDALLELNPNPDALVMEFELVPPADMDPFEALKRSWAFVRSLPRPTTTRDTK
jgi:sugar phosphate isomerase/epimerase